MISGLVSVSCCLSQSPNCSSIMSPAPVKKWDSESASRNLNVLRLTRGRSQLGQLKVQVKETTFPTTGDSTWCAIRTTLPLRTISTAFSGVQASHPRAGGLRVSNTKWPSSVRAERMAASDASSCSSSTNNWNACPVMTIRSNSRRQSTEARRRGPNLYRAASVPAPASPGRGRARTAVRCARLPAPIVAARPSRNRHRARSSPTSPVGGRSQNPAFPRRMHHIARPAWARKTDNRPLEESSRHINKPINGVSHTDCHRFCGYLLETQGLDELCVRVVALVQPCLGVPYATYLSTNPCGKPATLSSTYAGATSPRWPGG